MIRLLHAAVKGRARYKVDGLYRCEPLKAHLALKLAETQAISWFSASTLTGNVLIRFNSGSDPHSIASLVGLIVNEYHAQGAGRDRGKTGDSLGLAESWCGSSGTLSGKNRTTIRHPSKI